MNSLDTDVDALSDWAERRQHQHRTVAATWVAAAVGSGLLALLDEDLLLIPLLPLAAAATWLAGVWATERWRRARSCRAGHPIVRATVCWTQASRRQLPAGWQQPLIAGTLHRTPDDWTWRPCPLATPQFQALSWASHQVAATTLTPLWSLPGAPCAQLRLHLRTGATAELLVRHPSRLTTPSLAARRA